MPFDATTITLIYHDPLTMFDHRVCVHADLCPTLRRDGLLPSRLLGPWDFPGKNTGVAAIPSSRGSSPPSDQTSVSCFEADSLRLEPSQKP